MSGSLLQRLKSLHVEVPETEEAFNQFSLLQLQEMKIDFGTAHKGKTYQQVWKDHQSWVKWFLEHYGQSKKPNHRRVIHYFALEIERCELTNQAVPLKDVAIPETKSNLARPKPKSKGKAYPTEAPKGKTEWEQEWELQNLEMDPEDLIALQEENQSPEINQLNQRMSLMEDILNQIVQHLQKPTAVSSQDQ